MKDFRKVTLIYLSVLIIIFLYQTGIIYLKIFTFVLILVFAYFFHKLEPEGFIKDIISKDIKTNIISLFTGLLLVIPFYILYLVVFKKNAVFEIQKSNPVALIIMILIVAGEELFFRGYIQKKINESVNINISVFITAFYFCIYKIIVFLFFLNSVNISLILLTGFFGSVIVGYHFYYSKSILGAVSTHIVWNVLVLGGAVSQVKGWYI